MRLFTLRENESPTSTVTPSPGLPLILISGSFFSAFSSFAAGSDSGAGSAAAGASAGTLATGSLAGSTAGASDGAASTGAAAGSSADSTTGASSAGGGEGGGAAAGGVVCPSAAGATSGITARRARTGAMRRSMLSGVQQESCQLETTSIFGRSSAEAGPGLGSAVKGARLASIYHGSRNRGYRPPSAINHLMTGVKTEQGKVMSRSSSPAWICSHAAPSSSTWSTSGRIQPSGSS